MNVKGIIFFIISAIALALPARSATLYVGAGENYETIQAGLDAAVNGDTIIVRDGTYTGDGNRDIDFRGKAVTLCSENGPENCVIDCQGSQTDPHCGFYFHRGEDENSVLVGVTVTNAFGFGRGGGIYCSSASPTITYCAITGNAAMFMGGGIYCDTSSPTISNCKIAGNTSSDFGSGIYCGDNSAPSLINCTITGNRSDGAIIYSFVNSSLTISNCTITGNRGGGISCSNSSLLLANSILWGNTGVEITGGTSYTLMVRYCDIDSGAAAVKVYDANAFDFDTGNLDTDPLFIDAGYWDDNGTLNDEDETWIDGDYHLKSKYGRWDPAAMSGEGDWVTDSVTSLCIDAGDPEADYSYEPSPSFCLNIGAYGNTAEASKSGGIIPGDANGDCTVNILDLVMVRNNLFQDASSGDNWKADVNQDGKINILDLVYVRNRLNTKCEPNIANALAPLCFVPAGQFKTSTGVWVYLDAYYIDKYEVINELYCQFLNAGGNDDHWNSRSSNEIIKNGTGSYSVASGMNKRPVRYVNWFDAKAFCDWRSEEEGLPAGTYHLPTEAQWEKAAGWDKEAGKLWKYATRSDSISSATVNYDNNVGHTTDVGSYPYPSYYGCYDMSGNVCEWCQDWYDWYQSTYPSNPSNPTGPSRGTYRVQRGGFWFHDEINCRVSARDHGNPTFWYGGTSGFRCARTLN